MNREDKSPRVESIEELRIFARVVDAGSLSQAARTLGLPVNLVSRRLASLEERIGASLLSRTTRRMSLTEEGRRFHAHAVAILAAVDEVETELGSRRGKGSGLVRIALPTVMSRGGLIGRLGALQASCEGLEIQIFLRDGPVDLISDGLDLAIRIGDVETTGLSMRTLVRLTPGLAVSHEYARRHGTPEHPRDLAEHACLRFLGKARQTHWILLDRSGREHEVAVGPGLECDDSRTLMDAVHAGLGVGFLPRGEIELGATRGVLVPVLPGYHLPAFPVRVLSPPGRTRLLRVARVLEILEAWCRELK